MKRTNNNNHLNHHHHHHLNHHQHHYHQSNDDKQQSPPRSISQLVELARVPFDPNLPIKAYIQSCSLLYQKAKVYESENNLELAFIYLVRAAKVLVDDLPSKHPDYPLLPPTYQGSIQADGHHYMDTITPIKSQLIQRHSEYLRQSSGLNSLTTNSSSTKPKSSLGPTQTSYPSQSSNSRSQLYSGKWKSSTSSFSRHLSSQPDNQPPSPQPQLYSSTPNFSLGQVQPTQQPFSPKNSLESWELVRQSEDRITQIPQPLPKRDGRNDLIWPVELGEGRGQRMSVAMPTSDPPLKSKPHVSALIRSAGPQSLYKPPVPRQDEVTDLLNDDPLSGKFETQSPHADRHSSPPTRASRADESSPRSPKSPNELYSLERQSEEAPYQQIDRILAQAAQSKRPSLTPLPRREPGSATLDSIPYIPQSSSKSQDSVPSALKGSGKPTRRRKMSILVGKFAASSDNVLLSPRAESGPQSPTSATPSGKLRALVSPRFLRSSSNLSDQSLSSLPLSNPTSPTSPPRNAATSSFGLPEQSSQPPNPPRSRKSSLSDPSSWRWLKFMSPISSSRSPSVERNAKASSPKDLYSETDTAPSTGTQFRNGASSSSAIFSPLQSTSSSLSSNLGNAARDQNQSGSIGSPKPSMTSERRIAGLNLGSTPNDRRQSVQAQRQPDPKTRGPPESGKVSGPTTVRSPAVPPKIPPKRRSGSLDSISNGVGQLRGRTAQSLRSMVCPSDLIGTFVAIATPETERGVELCGLLLGKLTKKDVLVVTTLLIPKQVSTCDTCATTNEDETFRFQDQAGLMTLGWIHTHPTQTCFMSSVDLHTHASYQLMMAEAVAIVCSPKRNPSVGVFKLTHPIGLETIMKCKLPGLFHPHPAGIPIYTDADRGGHFSLIKSLELEIVDLRD